jgi:single-strand DNA-binding protein
MSDTITVTGYIATDPRHTVAGDGRLPITSFRLASAQRRFDRNEQKWVDGETNWFTVTAFRQLATNAAGSFHKKERVIVTGRLRIRDWVSGDRSGTTVEIEADSIGHDLFWGTTSFTRSVQSTLTRQEDQAEDALPDALRQQIAAEAAEEASDSAEEALTPSSSNVSQSVPF